MIVYMIGSFDETLASELRTKIYTDLLRVTGRYRGTKVVAIESPLAYIVEAIASKLNVPHSRMEKLPEEVDDLLVIYRIEGTETYDEQYQDWASIQSPETVLRTFKVVSVKPLAQGLAPAPTNQKWATPNANPYTEFQHQEIEKRVSPEDYWPEQPEFPDQHVNPVKGN